MNTPGILDKPAPQLRDLANGDTFSMAGLRGSVIRTLQGRVWVTQEGDPQDYVVPAHGRFCAAREGLIVVSALADGTQIAIYRTEPEPPGDWQRNAVRLDPAFAAAARRAARKEMAQWFAQLVCAGWRQLQRLWLRRPARHPVAVFPGRTGGYHC
jgi:hypothetical protein